MSTTEQAAQGGAPLGLAPMDWSGSDPDPLTRPGQGHRLGASGPRLDGALKVQGGAAFAAEFAYPGMVYAALAFSTIAKGRIAALDTAAAERAPGVVLVMTHGNAPRMAPMPMMMTSELAAGGDNLPIMQDDRVHWNGQPIAVVLAETQDQADHAASLLRVTYQAEPATTSWADGVANGVETGEMFGHPLAVETGDTEAALAAAAVSVDARFSTPYENHAAIEPHAATVKWDGDELTVHDASQAVVHTAWSLAGIFGIPQDKVHVTSPFVGGGFGGKMLWQHQVLAAAAAKLADRPVRLALSRKGVFRATGGRAATDQRVAIGADADGRFKAVIHTGISPTTRNNNSPEPASHSTSSSYAAGSFKLGADVIYLDMVANVTMRAPGEAVGNFALESAVDELAVALDLDPVELRLRNEPETHPIDGRPFSSRNAVQAWRDGAARFGWADRNPVPGAVRDGEWLVGTGCATASHPYVRFPSGAARMTLTRDGRAEVDIAAHDMGMGTTTAQIPVIAERLGLDPDQVSLRFGDSRMPGRMMAAGSGQSAGIGAAVAAAHRELVTDLLELVDDSSPLAGLKPDQVGALDGGLAALDDPHRHETYTDILDRAGRSELVSEADAPPPSEMADWAMHSFGAVFCEVRVNAVTGEIRVSRFLGSMDCGRILNARTAADQIRGGLVMGIGLALMEEVRFDERTGRIMNPNLAEYHVPVHPDVPEIDVIWTDIPDPHAPMGARGLGEISITGAGAAIANAVYNATGKRVRDLPITLDKLM
ncbi:xanthine dehydrogenase family protein molybdopterin-binding subunit [Streptomonospora sediminis]